jgi:asparaginyl-tRNA synthetase
MFGAIMRVRSVIVCSTQLFSGRFVYVNTPIITGSDAEVLVKCLKLPLYHLTEHQERRRVNYKEDFFGKETNLTVSGQLEGETFAMALGQIYTFGPV